MRAETAGSGTAVDPAAILTAARRELARLPDVLEALLGSLDADTWRVRPAPAEWSPIEIVRHLGDEETEDFGERVRVILEGGARFAPIYPERWALERRYREADPGEALAMLRARRAASLAMLTSATPERIVGAVELPKLGPMSGLDLLAAWVAHDRLHLAQLASTLARIWADRWAPLRAEYAGPLPYGN